MKLSKAIHVKTLAEKYNCEIYGNLDQLAYGINEIHKVEPGDICFADIPKYFDKVIESAATIIILSKKVDIPKGKTLFVHPEPFQVYNQISLDQHPVNVLTTSIDPTASIGTGTIVEPGAIIGPNVNIGKDCFIQALAVIREDTIIGDRVRIQSGALVGTDAFYFKRENEKYLKWNSCGRVIIGDDVEVGAGCTINKGVSGDTVIGAGTKMDSQIHIGHGAVIGKNCLMAAQVGVGGKTIIEDNVVMYGQVGIAQNLHIGKGAIILAKSGVSKNLKGGKMYFGVPAEESRQAMKELAALRRLPQILEDL
jgi:UDP-3-O-[3-hydroxymyristoyl] glucosamine N-acyltransferase